MDPKFILFWTDFLRESLTNSTSSNTSDLSNAFISFFIHMMLIYAKMESLFNMQTCKEWWKFPRQNTFWNLIQQQVWEAQPHYRDILYRRHYRMSFSLFHVLLSKIEPYMPSTNTIQFVREPIQSRKALCIVLHRLAHGTSTYIIAELYCVGESTVRKYTMVIVNIILQNLQNQYISIPCGTRLQNILSDFHTLTLLPTICGAIDGTHIKLSVRPGEHYTPTNYANRHHFYSVLLQGICDLQKVFWDVSVNAPGGAHDADHWNCSAIKESMQKREVLAAPTFQIDGSTIYPQLIGDSAYPISPYLVKPFNNSGSPLHTLFDKSLSRGRVKIENAFGILKERWRFLRDVGVELEKVPKIVVACCVLHNFLQMNHEDEPETQGDPHPNSTMPLRSTTVERDQGRANRDILFHEWERQYNFSIHG